MSFWMAMKGLGEGLESGTNAYVNGVDKRVQRVIDLAAKAENRGDFDTAEQLYNSIGVKADYTAARHKAKMEDMKGQVDFAKGLSPELGSDYLFHYNPNMFGMDAANPAYKPYNDQLYAHNQSLGRIRAGNDRLASLNLAGPPQPEEMAKPAPNGPKPPKSFRVPNNNIFARSYSMYSSDPQKDLGMYTNRGEYRLIAPGQPKVEYKQEDPTKRTVAVTSKGDRKVVSGPAPKVAQEDPHKRTVEYSFPADNPVNGGQYKSTIISPAEEASTSFKFEQEDPNKRTVRIGPNGERETVATPAPTPQPTPKPPEYRQEDPSKSTVKIDKGDRTVVSTPAPTPVPTPKVEYRQEDPTKPTVKIEGATRSVVATPAPTPSPSPIIRQEDPKKATVQYGPNNQRKVIATPAPTPKPSPKVFQEDPHKRTVEIGPDGRRRVISPAAPKPEKTPSPDKRRDKLQKIKDDAEKKADEMLKEAWGDDYKDGKEDYPAYVGKVKRGLRNKIFNQHRRQFEAGDLMDEEGITVPSYAPPTPAPTPQPTKKPWGGIHIGPINIGPSLPKASPKPAPKPKASVDQGKVNGYRF